MNMSRSELTKAAMLHLRLELDKPVDSGIRNIPVHCPFHSDRKASMFVNIEEGVFKCFQCHRGGSIESLFKELTGESLYKTLGISYDEFSAYAQRTSAPTIDFENMDRDIKLTITGGELTHYSASMLCRNYMRKRSIPSRIAEQMQFRVAEKLYINRTLFKDRLLIPIYEKDNLVSVEGRDMLGTQTPKVLYPKGSSVNTLYDIDKLDYDAPVYVVEGLMDLALLRCYPEFSNSTSIFGSSLTERQSYHLKKFPKVIFIPDNDAAGMDTLEIAKKRGMSNAYYLRIPEIINEVTIKDVGDVVNKAHLRLDELIKRKWLLRTYSVLT